MVSFMSGESFNRGSTVGQLTYLFSNVLYYFPITVVNYRHTLDLCIGASTFGKLVPDYTND